MKKWVAGFLGAAMLSGCTPVTQTFEETQSVNNVSKYDIVVYGGGTPAVASALQASKTTKDTAKILMIVPETKLGSIQTVGGQNVWDSIQYKDGYAQAGSFLKWNTLTSQYYNTDDFANSLGQEVRQHPNIEIKFNTTITGVKATEQYGTHQITQVEDSTGRHTTASIFIDASESGGLSQLTPGWKGTTGREDQGLDKKQMASTLMFKVKDVRAPGIENWHESAKGVEGGWGGYIVNHSLPFYQYKVADHPFKIKAFNIGEDGKDTNEYWLNMLLIHGISTTTEGIKPEVARSMAIEEIQKPEFLKLIRQIPGFEHIALVKENEQPVVGEILYTRETIHTSNNDGSYALSKTGAETGGIRYYDNRIGMGYYWFDNNSYEKLESHPLPVADEPWYVPYQVLTSDRISNLLIPGYAANIDSYAWTAMRVYPNLIMMGDAAGVAAGLTFQKQFSILQPTNTQIEKLQATLVKAGARLDK